MEDITKTIDLHHDLAHREARETREDHKRTPSDTTIDSSVARLNITSVTTTSQRLPSNTILELLKTIWESALPLLKDANGNSCIQTLDHAPGMMTTVRTQAYPPTFYRGTVDEDSIINRWSSTAKKLL